ncbi:MAG: hypothetical protein VX589_01770 [Myxococcota bacterium]|nr:hypothetical protein [Myxococcota bacterium]
MIRPINMLEQIGVSINALIVCLVGMPLLATAEPPGIGPTMITSLHTSVQNLENALTVLTKHTGSDTTHLRQAEKERQRLTSILDRYFHAKNQREPAARPTVLALRKHILRLQAMPKPLLVLRKGIIHFHRRVHWTLAMAYFRAGLTTRGQQHLRIILEAFPVDEAALGALSTPSPHLRPNADGPSGPSMRDPKEGR